MKGYFIEKDTIVINRDLTSLDIFVKDFLEILKKHSDYLVVSGFVSIATGRTRGTEDVDIIFPIINKNDFSLLFQDLKSNGFWCYQGENVQEVYDYIKELQGIRFARVNEMFPNIEFIPFNEKKEQNHLSFSILRRLE